MEQPPTRTIEYFSTYEAREDAFRSRVNALIPRKHAGASLFWEDFRQISFDRPHGSGGAGQAYITSNPRDCLAFGTPRQVLHACRMRAAAAGVGGAPPVEDVARDFGICEVLDQPIRSLSGGETVKLALAKSFVAAGYSRRLTIASPFSWLSANNTVYFAKLCAGYRELGIPVEVLALEGEDSGDGIGEKDAYRGSAQPGVDFELRLENARIRLGSFLHALHGREIHARLGDCRCPLKSPCLLVGENGQGKSLVAKTLAGAMDFAGTAQIGPAAGPGRVRLLFQDVVTQTLLRSFDGLAALPPGGSRSGMRMYRRIIAHAAGVLEARGQRLPQPDISGIPTLLEIKAMLIAVRLAAPCRALVLDEPDWGLTRASSVAVVSAAVCEAHRLGIPVILISHKPWWEPVAASVLEVRRGSLENDGSFRIRLTPRERGAP
jgi:energy-coupling factor transporter ATP-binding protein EcfA2